MICYHWSLVHLNPSCMGAIAIGVEYSYLLTDFTRWVSVKTCYRRVPIDETNLFVSVCGCEHAVSCVQSYAHKSCDSFCKGGRAVGFGIKWAVSVNDVISVLLCYLFPRILHVFNVVKVSLPLTCAASNFPLQKVALFEVECGLSAHVLCGK